VVCFLALGCHFRRRTLLLAVFGFAPANDAIRPWKLVSAYVLFYIGLVSAYYAPRPVALALCGGDNGGRSQMKRRWKVPMR